MAARKHWITYGSLATLDDADEVWLNLHDYTRQQAVWVVELVMKAGNEMLEWMPRRDANVGTCR